MVTDRERELLSWIEENPMMSQQELADRVGVSRQTINAVELGKYVPSAVLAMKVAAAFGRRVEEVFTLEEED